MQRYRNLHGGSGVAAYQTGPDYIRVKFRHGGTYEYDYDNRSTLRGADEGARCFRRRSGDIYLQV